MIAGVGGIMAVGWAYEGPRRFIRRLPPPPVKRQKILTHTFPKRRLSNLD